MDISQNDKVWLGNEVLKENFKFVYRDGKFVFNLKYYIKDKR